MYGHTQKKTFQTSINDAFTENNLNTIIDRNNQTDANFIEDYYDKYYENPSSISIKKIIDDLKRPVPDGKNFTSSDFIQLLKFSIISSARNPFCMNEILCSSRMAAYVAVYFKFFLDYGTVNFPYEIEVNKNHVFSHLRDITRGLLIIADLKLTIFYHKIPNQFFLLPDKFVCIHSPNNTKFADKQLKIYMPISSNIVLCLERIERSVTQATCLIDENDVIQFNKYFLKNFYEYIGCENQKYLKKFLNTHQQNIHPLKRFDPNSDPNEIKNQIQTEILQKIVLKGINGDSVLSYINHNLEFKIITEESFRIISLLSNSTIPFKKRRLEL